MFYKFFKGKAYFLLFATNPEHGTVDRVGVQLNTIVE
jgi:hypothetical protein